MGPGGDSSQIGGFAGRTPRPICDRRNQKYLIRPGPPERAASPEDSGEFDRVEQVRPLKSRGSTGAIPGWRFPRDLARNLCALCDDRRADPAGRVEILERRSAGGLCDPERGAATALSRYVEVNAAEGAVRTAPLRAEFLLARVKEPI